MVPCDTTRKSFFRECKLGKEKAKREMWIYDRKLCLPIVYH